MVVNDPANVGDKTFTLELSAGSGFALGSQSSTTMTIVEALSVIEWTAASYSIKEDAGTDTTIICAGINPAPENELTVSFTTGMTADTSDTDATEGTDYTITTKSLTFPANSTDQRCASIMVVNDTATTVDKTFTLELSAGSSFALGSQASATITITNVEALSFDSMDSSQLFL